MDTNQTDQQSHFNPSILEKQADHTTTPSPVTAISITDATALTDGPIHPVKRQAAPPDHSLSTLIRAVLRSPIFMHEEVPFRASLKPGHPNLAIITGSNASGKTVAAQSLHALASVNGIRPELISMRVPVATRHPQPGFIDYPAQASGSAMVGPIIGALRRFQARAKEGMPALLILDEPELGLSEDYVVAMGGLIAKTIRDLGPDATASLVLVTHSKALVSSILDATTTPSWLAMGHDPQPDSLKSWLSASSTKSISDLLGLEDAALARWQKLEQAITAIPAKQPEPANTEPPIQAAPPAEVAKVWRKKAYPHRRPKRHP